MTPEEIAKLSLEATVAELRHFATCSGIEARRYETLRRAVYRAWVEHLGDEDAEFLAYAEQSNGLIASVMMNSKRRSEVFSLMESNEAAAAMKVLHEKIERDDAHDA